MKANIGPMDLVDNVKEPKGFMKHNTGRTLIWGKLERGALTLIPLDRRPYTDEIELYINDGGVDHDTPKKHFKKVFREDILPAIKKLIGSDVKSFRLVLNFNVDMLTKVMFDDGQ